jgi:ABC-type molybdate transport system ATPase subunit
VKLEVAIRRQLGATALNVDFAAEAPVVGLFGRSGSGKSSVVNAIAGLLKPDAGRIVIDGSTRPVGRITCSATTPWHLSSSYGPGVALT